MMEVLLDLLPRRIIPLQERTEEPLRFRCLQLAQNILFDRQQLAFLFIPFALRKLNATIKHVVEHGGVLNL